MKNPTFKSKRKDEEEGIIVILTCGLRKVREK